MECIYIRHVTPRGFSPNGCVAWHSSRVTDAWEDFTQRSTQSGSDTADAERMISFSTLHKSFNKNPTFISCQNIHSNKPFNNSSVGWSSILRKIGNAETPECPRASRAAQHFAWVRSCQAPSFRLLYTRVCRHFFFFFFCSVFLPGFNLKIEITRCL